MFWEQQSKFGTTPIQNEATQYGEGTITGIDLPGESRRDAIDSYLTRAKLHAEAPKALSVRPVVVHRRQHRDGLRSGRDRADAH